MSRRYSRREAEAILADYIERALGNEATTLQSATQVAVSRLNRAARRAMGGRGDGRFHPAATTKAAVRTRNAW